MVGTPCMIHLLGRGLGQKGSTLYTGIGAPRSAAKTKTQTPIKSANRAILNFILILCLKAEGKWRGLRPAAIRMQTSLAFDSEDDGSRHVRAIMRGSAPCETPP